MPDPKTAKTAEGELLHFSVGAVIRKNGKYLLIDRAIPPLGFAGIAGHIDEGENEEQAIIRETREEVGLELISKSLLFEEELDWNWCNKGVNSHYWYLFQCEVAGEINRSKGEAKAAGWFTKEEIKKLKLEPVWEYWFKKLNII